MDTFDVDVSEALVLFFRLEEGVEALVDKVERDGGDEIKRDEAIDGEVVSVLLDESHPQQDIIEQDQLCDLHVVALADTVSEIDLSPPHKGSMRLDKLRRNVLSRKEFGAEHEKAFSVFQLF